MIATPKPRPSTGNWTKGNFNGRQLRPLKVYKAKFKLKPMRNQVISMIRTQLAGWLMIRQDENGDWLFKCEDDVVPHIKTMGVVAGLSLEELENEY